MTAHSAHAIPSSQPDGPETQLTPMMQQYWETKKRYPGCILFYRLGDFYELFFDDAVQVSSALNLTLTKRGKHDQQDIPMCGVPVSHYETYLNRLVHQGFRVAVCEQMEDPVEAKKRGPKSVVRRQVIRVVTRGTLTEDALLSATQYNYLIALVEGETSSSWTVAYTDISTGSFWLESVPASGLAGCLYRLNPSEILVEGSRHHALTESLLEWADRMVPMTASPAPLTRWDRTLQDHLKTLEPAQQQAVWIVLHYLEQTQVETLPRLDLPRLFHKKGMMEIDVATWRNLEIEQSFKGEQEKSLIYIMEHTLTPQGGRLLRSRLQAPLAQADGIQHRLNHVAWWHQHSLSRQKVRLLLKHMPDFQRILGRVALKRASPRDLKALLEGLNLIEKLREHLQGLETPPRELQKFYEDLLRPNTLQKLLQNALAEEIPAYTRDGNVIRPGYNATLDTLRQAEQQSRQQIVGLQTQYIQETGVTTLKVRHNAIVGYYVEIPSSQSAKMGPRFIHRQTLANATRYSTTELYDLEKHVMASTQEALTLELQLFDQLLDAILVEASVIDAYAHASAGIDVTASLAELATMQGYTRPLVDESLQFHIVGGRHPVIEALAPHKPFIRNDCCLDPDQRLGLITGPNMGGKSTFLRQTALIVLMAQMGSFVPAEHVHLGVVDRLFSRVGASDDLARGHSTFMVEMMETAMILQKATPHSYVILDEIGRGTSTQDGLALAWAILEHLHTQIWCRGLFATHYHELTHLHAQLPALRCYTAEIQEWKDQVIFLHRMVPGVAQRSFGLHVATMAGLPQEVVTRAENLLQQWGSDLPPSPSLHEKPPTSPPLEEGRFDPSLLHDLRTLALDRMTAKEALDWLYDAQHRAQRT